MKLVLGIILVLVGGLALAIGLVVCVVTLTSDYASSACERAAKDEKAFSEARVKCGSTTSDCYKQETIGLTTQDDCDSKKAFMTRQLIMGIVPAALGAFVVLIGGILIILSIIGRRKKATA